MGSHSEMVFGQAGGRELRLDLYRPDGEPKALILMVHGGGWRRGSRQGIAAYGPVFARLGFAVMAAEYRLLGEAPWPAQLDDVKAAAAWAEAKAGELGVPAGRIVLFGFSAGGHLALLAADDIKGRAAAVVALFTPVELVTAAPDAGQTEAGKLLEGAASDAAARLASPLHRAGPGFPPTFLIHGAEDWLVPHVTSQRMFDVLTAAGVKAELHIYAGLSHEFADAPYMMEAMAAEVDNFLRRTVVDPVGSRQEDLAHNPFARGPEALKG
jgi:acetyl esterase/lipase